MAFLQGLRGGANHLKNAFTNRLNDKTLQALVAPQEKAQRIIDKTENSIGNYYLLSWKGASTPEDLIFGGRRANCANGRITGPLGESMGIYHLIEENGGNQKNQQTILILTAHKNPIPPDNGSVIAMAREARELRPIHEFK